ncbi:hypothetical protein GIB67_015792 [Kingdonia uniflora]|uniref:Uncharacterized protein n=1 Tax=Kingdonia uniflora TaxID=39325 RepID=A0A7J7NUV9_9MAGN|nr:hypothetical protein GIB67_015792 [Kingdonia uniflora]
MASIYDCAKADKADLVGNLSPVIGVRDKEDTVAELIEWPLLKGSRVEYPIGSSRFGEFYKAKSSIDGIRGHAFAYRGNFFRTCSVSQGGDYLYLLPDLAKEKKCRHLGDKVSLEYVQGVLKDSRTDGFCCYLVQFDYGLTLPLRYLAKSVMNLIGVCPAQLNCNFWEVIFVCKTLNGRWPASGSEKSSARPCFFDLSSAGRVWNDNRLWVSGKCLQRSDEEPLELKNRTITKVSRKESFIDVVAREGTELEAVLKELEISRFKRVASKDDKVRRSQAKRRLVGKTPGSMEEKLTTAELNIPLKIARLNEILDGPVDMVTVSSTIVQNLAKRKAIKRGAAPRSVSSVSVDDSSKRRKVISPTKLHEMLEESDKIAEGSDLRLGFEVKEDLLEKQCRAKAREKMVAVMDDEFKKDVHLGSQDRSMELEKKTSQLEGEKNQLEEKLTRERVGFQLEREKEKEVVALKLKQVRAKSKAEAERLATASAISWDNLEGKLYQLRYTKAEITAFSEGNYVEMEIMDEEEVEEWEGGLNTAEKTDGDNKETINQEIENSRLRVVDSEGLPEVEKKSSVELQKELDIAREREEQTLLYNAEYAEEYEALVSQYEDQLDDNVKFSLKLKEAKRQVMEKTGTILSRDLALSQLTSELVELKEKATSGSWHKAELAEYRIRVLNEEISDMKCNIRVLNELLLKREIDLDTALDSLKAYLRRLIEREAKSRADLAEVQAKNKNLVDYLAHVRGNVRRAVQHDKEMNERINQLCARISESERELGVRELKYQKDLKFELDTRDCEIAYGEGSREIKEFLRRKEELEEIMCIDPANSRQKSIDLTRQMSERIDQLIAELAESKARRWKDNKRVAVTHQAFKELVVHEQ